MVDNSAGIVSRHFVPETDFPRLLRLLGETEAVDQTGEDISEETQRELMGLPGHEPTLDRRVVADPNDAERLIAFCLIWHPLNSEVADCYAVVHPTWRRHGIGEHLTGWLLQRASELDVTTARAYANVQLAEANTFLRRRGFHEVSAYTQMRLPADTQVDAPAWPAGYSARHYDPATDFLTWLDACNRSYRGLWGHHEMTEEEMKIWLPDYSFDGAFLLYGPAGDVVGLCRSEISTRLSEQRGHRTGYIDAPGIVAEHRDKNLYLPLLLTGLHWLRAQGQMPIELESWGDSTHTLTAYQQTGFTIIRQEISYRRDLK